MSMTRVRFFRILLACVMAALIGGKGYAVDAAPPAAPHDPAGDLARPVIAEAGAKSGLIIHCGCADGRLTAALYGGPGWLVQGLDTEPNNVSTARQHAKSLGLSGKVSVDGFDGVHLPYVDNLVNLLVISGPQGALSETEILRALAPRGVAVFLPSGNAQQAPRTLRKPVPSNIDEWGHFLHGPDNNAVANDHAVGVPCRIQWVADPKHMRSHSMLSSLNAMVSAGGRLFYIIDLGDYAFPATLPGRWTLVAKDAFNGVTLWQRELEQWQLFLKEGRTNMPPDLPRRLVADGDRVYVTLGIHAPVSELDAATGQVLTTYGRTEQTEEILCSKGVLYLAVRVSPPADAERNTGLRKTVDTKRLVALKADSGAVLWEKSDADTVGILPMTLAVSDGTVVFHNEKGLVCLSSESGDLLWKHDRPTPFARFAYSVPTVVIRDGVVLCADSAEFRNSNGSNPGILIALDAATGEQLWNCEAADAVFAPPDVFVVGDRVWSSAGDTRKSFPYPAVHDLKTGAVSLKPPAPASADYWSDWHHHRCYRNKATADYILTSRSGVGFVNTQTGRVDTNCLWMRGACQYGILPCNGMIYQPPDQCACYSESAYGWLQALAPRREEPKPSTAPALTQYPALARRQAAQATAPVSDPKSTDWPTYRSDSERSGFSRAVIDFNIAKLWERPLGGESTTLVCANGKLYLANTADCTVMCLDAASGERVWEYVADGPVDSPPTVAQGMAVFGCRDGYVTALDAQSGEALWRFRAAPQDQRIIDRDKLESVWPVFGSVVVKDSQVYCCAGRSADYDGGVHLYKLDLATGKMLAHQNYDSRDPKTGLHRILYKPFSFKADGAGNADGMELPGLMNDILSANADGIQMRTACFNKDLAILPERTTHLFHINGFLEDSWWERSYWVYGQHFFSGNSGWKIAQDHWPSGNILAFDDQRVFGYETEFQRIKSHVPKLFSAAREPKHVKPTVTLNRNKQKRLDEATSDKQRAKMVAAAASSSKQFNNEWETDSPLIVRGMVVSPNALIIAGGPSFDAMKLTEHIQSAYAIEDVAKERKDPQVQDAVDRFEGRKGCAIIAVDKATGKELKRFPTDACPRLDGMIAANGRLYMATTDGRVVCYGTVKAN